MDGFGVMTLFLIFNFRAVHCTGFILVATISSQTLTAEKFWFNANELSKHLSVSQLSVRISVKRGEMVVKAEQSELVYD